MKSSDDLQNDPSDGGEKNFLGLDDSVWIIFLGYPGLTGSFEWAKP